ncbi:MAG: enolase [Deltaproteobacteria bacterium]|nr:enolase [Deltaproteobacteria bacterium]
MKVVGLTIQPLRIPFVERFQHSLKDRAASDTVVVRVQLEDGTYGYGEGLPRPYVTGETVETLVTHVSEQLWPALVDQKIFGDELLANLSELIPTSTDDGPVRAHNSARCAVEVAVVDAVLRSRAMGLHDLLPPTADSLTYSGVITAGDLESVARRARQLMRVGLSHIKVKVGLEDTVERIAAIRKELGPDSVLRIDANAAWTVDQAAEVLQALEPYNVASCEEPLAPQSWSDLAELRQRVSTPLIADESLVTASDAQQLVAHEAIDLFNIRLSKCGGIGPCLELAAYAREHGLGYQVGAHVGETALLSAVGRHFAAHLGDARFVEGSYGTLLLTEDLSRTSLRFGHQGKGTLLKGPGLGVDILEERLEGYAVGRLEFSA